MVTVGLQGGIHDRPASAGSSEYWVGAIRQTRRAGNFQKRRIHSAAIGIIRSLEATLSPRSERTILRIVLAVAVASTQDYGRWVTGLSVSTNEFIDHSSL
jgi:hypothetical protein